MPRTDNYSLYECDRCGRQEYIVGNSPNRSNWRDAVRTDASDVSTSYLLCSSCSAEYKEMVSRQDTEFRQFMTEGRAKHDDRAY